MVNHGNNDDDNEDGDEDDKLLTQARMQSRTSPMVSQTHQENVHWPSRPPEITTIQ